MKQLLTTLSYIQSLGSNQHLLICTAPDLPAWRAGQLALVRVNDSYDPYLRRAYFLVPTITPTPNAVSLISHEDTFAHASVGDTLDFIAPIGNGFALDASTRRLLLISDVAHLAPLIALAHEATHRQIAVTLFVEATATQKISWLGPWLPLAVEYQIAPDFSTALPELLRWADQCCVALPLARYVSFKALITDARMTTAGFAQAIVAPPLACGFGACLACVVETTRGRPLACVHGPVFDLFDLAL